MSKVTREMIAAAHDVTMRHKIVLGHELLTKIYQTMDAKREFMGLTEYDIDQIPYSCSHADSRLIAYAIEAKLREKNA